MTLRQTHTVPVAAAKAGISQATGLSYDFLWVSCEV